MINQNEKRGKSDLKQYTCTYTHICVSRRALSCESARELCDKVPLTDAPTT